MHQDPSWAIRLEKIENSFLSEIIKFFKNEETEIFNKIRTIIIFQEGTIKIK